MSTVVRCGERTFCKVITLASHIIQYNIIRLLYAVIQVAVCPRDCIAIIIIANLIANRRCSHIGEIVITHRTNYLLVIAW